MANITRFNPGSDALDDLVPERALGRYVIGEFGFLDVNAKHRRPAPATGAAESLPERSH